MKKVRFFNIEWDTDDHEADLPAGIILEVDSALDVAYQGADVLSDEFGWCVIGFEFEVIE